MAPPSGGHIRGMILGVDVAWTGHYAAQWPGEAWAPALRPAQGQTLTLTLTNLRYLRNFRNLSHP